MTLSEGGGARDQSESSIHSQPDSLTSKVHGSIDEAAARIPLFITDNKPAFDVCSVRGNYARFGEII